MGIRKKKPAAMAAADISCPTCGSVNGIRVAGVYESPRTPANWYCRCDHCRRGFNARPKEDGDDSVGRPSADLSKEELLELINKGMSNEEIADAKDIGATTVVRYKKKYGLTGIAKRGRKKIGGDSMEIMTTVEQVEGKRENLEPEAIALFNSEGEIQVELTTKMTIAQVLEYKNRTQNDLDCIKSVIEALSARGEKYQDLTPGVDFLLKNYRDRCAETLDRINKAFETVEISI